MFKQQQIADIMETRGVSELRAAMIWLDRQALQERMRRDPRAQYLREGLRHCK